MEQLPSQPTTSRGLDHPAVADLDTPGGGRAKPTDSAALREARAQLASAAGARRAARALQRFTTSSDLLANAPRELGTHTRFDRVQVSLVDRASGFERLVPLQLWTDSGGDEAPSQRAVQLAYPMMEADVARVGDARVVRTSSATATFRAPGDGWAVVAALVVRDVAVGLVHACRAGHPLQAADAQSLGSFARRLAHLCDEAELRRALETSRIRRQEAMERLAWQDDGGGWPAGSTSTIRGGRELAGSLTSREREVVDLLVDGLTNRAIAERLFIGESTVKYHVKSVLRKLGATSRAHAVAIVLDAREAG